jgi:hypothetical protein
MGAGGEEVLAGLEARLERPGEQLGELAPGEVGADVGAAAGLLEEVRTFESHCRPPEPMTRRRRNRKLRRLAINCRIPGSPLTRNNP